MQCDVFEKLAHLVEDEQQTASLLVFDELRGQFPHKLDDQMVGDRTIAFAIPLQPLFEARFGSPRKMLLMQLVQPAHDGHCHRFACTSDQQRHVSRIAREWLHRDDFRLQSRRQAPTFSKARCQQQSKRRLP